MTEASLPPVDDGFDIEATLGALSDANAEIDSQNITARQATNEKDSSYYIANNALRKLALGRLLVAQKDSFDRRSAAWEELVPRDDQETLEGIVLLHHQELKQSEVELAEQERALEEAMTNLDADRNRTIAIVGNSREVLDAYESERERIVSPLMLNTQALEARVQDIRRQQDYLVQLGQPWVIPQLYHPPTSGAEGVLADESESIPKDEIAEAVPVDPEVVAIDGIVNSRRKVEASNATPKLAAILSSRVGEELTSNELAVLLYPDSETDMRTLQNRISALVHENNTMLHGILAEQRLGVTRTVILEPYKRKNGGNSHRRKLVVVCHRFEDKGGKELSVVVPAVQATPLSSQRTEHITTRKSVASERRKELTRTQRMKRIGDVLEEQLRQKLGITEPPRWEHSFMSRTIGSVSELAVDDLIFSGTLGLNEIARRSECIRLRDLEEAVNDARQEGLVSRNNYRNKCLDVGELVVTRMLRRNIDILGQGNRQTRSKEIIQSLITLYNASTKSIEERLAIP